MSSRAWRVFVGKPDRWGGRDEVEVGIGNPLELSIFDSPARVAVVAGGHVVTVGCSLRDLERLSDLFAKAAGALRDQEEAERDSA